MACTIVQADLGPLFADVDADLAADFIETAVEIVLGPAEKQVAAELAYTTCGIDPCRMVKLLAQHLLATTPGVNAGTTATVTAERVGDVSVNYADASSSSGLFKGSPFGTQFAFLLAKYEKCRARRRSLPRSFGPTSASRA